MIAIPRKASTVILLRDHDGKGVEVFLLKRHEKSSFMGGNYVSPGGRVDREDGSPGACSQSKGVSPKEAFRQFGGDLTPAESLAHWVAAIRELFEEAGVLLAYDETGKLLHLKESANRERYLHYRKLLQQGNLTICQIASQEKLFLALDHLHYYAHWITPEALPERFDTRFFLARHPSGQEASHDQKETIAEIWMTPKEALDENLKGTMALSPPTLKILEDLSRHKSMDDLFASLQNKEIRPVLPIFTRLSDETTLLFPWDPEYAVFKKGQPEIFINNARPSQKNDNTTRLTLRKGIWYPYCLDA